MTSVENSRRFWVLLILAISITIYALRLTGPTDLENSSQSRNIGYILDLLHRGHWLVQYDIEGRILSKPPLHTWLISPFVLMFGVNRFTLTLPSFLAVTSLALLVFHIGRKQFGTFAGGLAGFSMILAPMLAKHIALVRSDGVFSLAIAAGAWAAYRAWRHNASWTPFWIFGAISTLTKGPLGLALSAAGLLACFWEKRDKSVPKNPAPHWPGILWFFGICLAWVVPALVFHYREIIDKMIMQELVGHISGNRSTGDFPGSNLPKPTMNYFSRFVPFSLFTFYAMWRAWRRPSENREERAYERFLTCSIIVGLFLFSIAAHFRPDLLLPLWAAGALLAGREGRRLASKMGGANFAALASVAAAALIFLVYGGYHPKPGAGDWDAYVDSEDPKNAAQAFPASGIDWNTVEYISGPATFQMYLGTATIWKKPEEILALHHQRPGPMYVATQIEDLDPNNFEHPKITERFRWPQDPQTKSVIRVFQLDW